MRIARHPDVSTLLTCAAGSQPEALCAVVASHICVCPKCLKALKDMHEIGVVLFDTIAPVALSEPMPQLPVDGPRQGAVAQVKALQDDGDIPRTLHRVLGNSLDALAWCVVEPGIEQHVVPLTPGAPGDLRIFKLAPGVGIREHGHHGEELSLVLRGTCRDERGSYTAGDFMDLDDEVRHAVVAGDAGCILIIGSERVPEFLG